MLNKIVCTTLLIFGITFCNGQDNIVKASALIGNLGVQYERALGSHFSLVGQLGQSTITNSVNDVETKSTGIGFHLEGRYYLSSKKETMEGWHIGPYYTSINTKDRNDLETNISSVGLATGYQWIFNSNITLGVVLGAGTFNLDSDQNRGILLEGLTFWPHIGVNMGYRF